MSSTRDTKRAAFMEPLMVGDPNNRRLHVDSAVCALADRIFDLEDRLAEVTGEGHALGNLRRYCLSRNRVTQLSGCPCIACEVADAQRPQVPEPEPTPDTRTPGQVAYEAWCAEHVFTPNWAKQSPITRIMWNVVAAAVLRHGGPRE